MMINMLDVPLCSCGQVCASQCHGWRTRTKRFSLSCRFAGNTRCQHTSETPTGGSAALISTALELHLLISLFPLSVSTVRMRIIPTVRLCLTSWRWLFRLKSSYRGEFSVRIPSFELQRNFNKSLGPCYAFSHIPSFLFKCVSTR